MLNHSHQYVRPRCFLILKVLLIFLLPSSLLLTTQVYASGAYMPGASPKTKSQYNEGKMLFHKEVKVQKFSSCMECYKKNKTIKSCQPVKQCLSSSFSDSNIEALKYFLKKRYRIN